MGPYSRCQETFSACTDAAGSRLGLIDLVFVGLILLAVVGVLALLRRLPVKAGTVASKPLSPEYDSALQRLEALKSGRLWGDVGQAEPWRGTFN